MPPVTLVSSESPVTVLPVKSTTGYVTGRDWSPAWSATGAAEAVAVAPAVNVLSVTVISDGAELGPKLLLLMRMPWPDPSIVKVLPSTSTWDDWFSRR